MNDTAKKYRFVTNCSRVYLKPLALYIGETTFSRRHDMREVYILRV